MPVASLVVILRGHLLPDLGNQLALFFFDLFLNFFRAKGSPARDLRWSPNFSGTGCAHVILPEQVLSSIGCLEELSIVDTPWSDRL